jgi:hypothetical protein
MPPIGGFGKPTRKRKPDPRAAAQRRHGRPDTRQHADAPPRPTITRPISAPPFQAQQKQAHAQTRAAVRHLPKPVIAAPPIIHNPTPQQTRAAKAQIVASVRRQIGDTHGQERVDRTQQIYDQIRHDPGMARVRRSMEHWQREDQKLTRPDATYYPAKPGAPDRKAHLGVGGRNFATVNLTAAGLLASELAAQGRARTAGRHQPRPLRQERVQGRRHHRHRPVHRRSHARRARQGRRDRPPLRAGQRALELGEGMVKGTSRTGSTPPST